MKKILLYLGLVIAGAIVIIAFITATNYIHLILASLLYPPLIFFAYKVFSMNSVVVTANSLAGRIHNVPPPQPKKLETSKKEYGEYVVSDIDKRAFLKLVGATGLSFLAISIFGRRLESLFFGQNILQPPISNISQQGGLAGNVAATSPTDGYSISQVDNSLNGYYGFTNKDGAWFIMKEDSAEGSFRYAIGKSNFSANWDNREQLKYDYFHKVFY